MPEILGAVEDATHTHGYIVAIPGSLNQVFAPPEKGAIHEFYHLLGCPHSLSLTKCYEVIATLKQHAQPETDFFPGITPGGSYLTTRDAVNTALHAAIAKADAARHAPSHY